MSPIGPGAKAIPVALFNVVGKYQDRFFGGSPIPSQRFFGLKAIPTSVQHENDQVSVLGLSCLVQIEYRDIRLNGDVVGPMRIGAHLGSQSGTPGALGADKDNLYNAQRFLADWT